MKRPRDPEIMAMGKCIKALEGLPKSAQLRALAFIVGHVANVPGWRVEWLYGLSHEARALEESGAKPGGEG